MADPVTLADIAALANQHADIRKEAVDHTNEIVREGLKGDFETVSAIKDSRYDTVTRIEDSADRVERSVVDTHNELSHRFFTIGRDTQDLRAQVIAQQQQLVAGFAGASKDTEIASLKGIIEGQKNTHMLAEKISTDGDRTRALINDLKNSDLNRYLIERNAELVEERHGHRHWRGAWDQSQFSALQSQFQALNSQFSETRQNMVNFGTMAGVGQTSSANTVR